MEIVKKVTLDMNGSGRKEHFEIGDQLLLDLRAFESYTATAQKITDNGVLFMFDMCLMIDRQMNKTSGNNGGFDKSDLCHWMNTSLLDAFPDEIRNRLKPLKSGNLLDIPSIGEIFGKCKNWKDYESDFDEQFSLMWSRKNRACYDDKDRMTYYWLRNQKMFDSGFAVVDCAGELGSADSSFSRDIRPVFLLGKKE